MLFNYLLLHGHYWYVCIYALIQLVDGMEVVFLDTQTLENAVEGFLT